MQKHMNCDEASTSSRVTELISFWLWLQANGSVVRKYAFDTGLIVLGVLVLPEVVLITVIIILVIECGMQAIIHEFRTTTHSKKE